jgi:hypothetical protein
MRISEALLLSFMLAGCHSPQENTLDKPDSKKASRPVYELLTIPNTIRFSEIKPFAISENHGISGKFLSSDLNAVIEDVKIRFHSYARINTDSIFVSLEINGNRLDSLLDEDNKMFSITSLASAIFLETSHIPFYKTGDGGKFFFLEYGDQLANGVYHHVQRGILIYDSKKETKGYLISTALAVPFYLAYDSTGEIRFLQSQYESFPVQDDETVCYKVNIGKIDRRLNRITSEKNADGNLLHAELSSTDMFNDSEFVVHEKNW